eukprot:gene11895-13128_t
MADSPEAPTAERPAHLRNKLSKYVNLGLCIIGIVFVITGVFKSTLLLYIGCALVGAAVGGFIRSRLPLHGMGPATGLHVIYRSELQRNVQSFHDNLQTFVVMHAQQPCGIKQKKINKHTSIAKYTGNMTIANNDSFDRISIISSMTDVSQAGEACCIICLVQLKRGQEVRQLPCQHVFHIGCIDRWLKINRLCPTCRNDITLPVVKLREPHVKSHVVDIDDGAESLVLNNHTAVGEADNRLTEQGDPATITVSNDTQQQQRKSKSSSSQREDNIMFENEINTSLITSNSHPADVIITTAELTRHASSSQPSTSTS